MANITAHRTGEIQRAVLNILTQHPEGLRAKDVLQKVADSLELTDFEKGNYASGVRRFEKIARFSTIGLVKAGWLIKDSGIWSVTPDGKTALSQHKDVEDFKKAVDAKYREWEAGQPEDKEVETSEESVSSIATLEEAEEDAWTEISDYLSELPPYDFQDLVAGLIEAMGYHVSYVSPPGPDRGVDIVATVDPLGIQGTRIKVQVKRRADKADADAIRSFLSLINDNDAGIFVNLGGFTNEAERIAREQERRKLTLIDGQKLLALWVEHYSKLKDTPRRLLPVKPIYFLNLGE
ncbi:MAG: restriction endonuclease [Verrucomicrobia bacterium Tous-C9LFEB]|nr:MAG: restriction endonuclease [Verrucomicrobia bacterium Tous-C9LFEB]